VGIVIETIGGRLGLVVVLAVVAGRRLLLRPLANDSKLLVGHLHDLFQRLLEVHFLPFARLISLV
jgi:hypothetical protein